MAAFVSAMATKSRRAPRWGAAISTRRLGAGPRATSEEASSGTGSESRISGGGDTFLP